MEVAIKRKGKGMPLYIGHANWYQINDNVPKSVYG